MRILTTYSCPARSDVILDVKRYIEVRISKAGEEPAELFYSPYAIRSTGVSPKAVPALVSAVELMLAQAQALEVLEAESGLDPIAAEVLERIRRQQGKVVEGEIGLVWGNKTADYVDVEDPDGSTVQGVLEEMLNKGQRVARVQITDPDDRPPSDRGALL